MREAPLRTGLGFLRTRIARRILLSFVACALLPVVLLALVAHRQVTRQLGSQTEARLREASKSAGMAVLQRLLLLSGELELIGRRLAAAGATTDVVIPNDRFRSVQIVSSDDAVVSIAALGESRRDRLLAGEPILRAAPGTSGRVLIARNLGTAQVPILVVGEPAPAFVAGFEPGNRDGGSDLCLLDDQGAPLACSPSARAIADGIATADARAAFEWSDGDERSIAAAWPVFLRTLFDAPSWTMVASEPRAEVFAAVRQFEQLLAIAFLLAIVVVLFLSHIQIRRSLEPVERLQEGTRRIADRDFTSRVEITSGDEFEQLAESFNAMSTRLGLQFRALAARSEVDRAVLSALDVEQIVRMVLQRGGELVSNEGMAVVILPDGERSVNAFTVCGDEAPQRQQWLVGDAELLRLGKGTDLVRLGEAQQPAGLVPLRLREDNHAAWTLAPMRANDRLGGWLVFRHASDRTFGYDERGLARGLADQVAVALSNARLVDELDALRWGALHALARAIDAKSPWTAGHSERVTEYALRLGRRLGLSIEEMDLLRRGGLLHDVGKIGVPADVLDKPGKLTDDEWKMMRDHPTIGARILEPIAQYRDVLPMVLYHHEKYDGTGYPERRAAEDIPYFARILAVADVYDALTSDRPYRAGMPHDVAMRIIRKDAGTHFDPFLAELFVQIMEDAAADVTDTGSSNTREITWSA